MAVTNIARSLRDGELVIKDGTTPTAQSLTLLLDEGDLAWTERANTIEVKDRKSGEREDIALGSIVEHLVALCR